MVTASSFYKYIGTAGYNILIEKKVVPPDFKFINKNIGKSNTYKFNYTGNSTAYGKFIEGKIISALQGTDNTILTYLPNINIDNFKKEFNNGSRIYFMINVFAFTSTK
jgi:hypothetical protein